MNSKRGQETGTALIWWLVALVVFGLLIWWAYNFYSEGAEKIALLPEDISWYAGLCDGYGQLDIATSTSAYCREFKEVKLSGSTVYLNCQDARVQAVVKNKIDCTGLAERDMAIVKCKELSQTEGNKFDGTKLLMNELGTCDELLANAESIDGTCESLNGDWVSGSEGGTSISICGRFEDLTSLVTKDKKQSPPNFCCKQP